MPKFGIMCIFVILTAFILPAFGKSPTNPSCATKDLSDQLPPVGQQKSCRWCFAWVAANIVSVELHQKISAADIALNWGSPESKYADIAATFKKENSNCVGNSGTPKLAIKSMNESGGFCAEDDFPSLQTPEGLDIETLFQAVHRQEVAQIKPCSNSANGHLLESQLKDLTRPSAIICKEKIASIDSYRKAKCKSRAKVNSAICDVTLAGNRRSQVDAAVSRLFTENRPTGLAVRYDSVSAHGLTLIGQQINPKTKKCDLLIRNSWGKDCGKRKILKSEHLQRWVKIGFENCFGGSFLLPKEALAEALLSTSYFTESQAKCDADVKSAGFSVPPGVKIEKRPAEN